MGDHRANAVDRLEYLEGRAGQLVVVGKTSSQLARRDRSHVAHTKSDQHATQRSALRLFQLAYQRRRREFAPTLEPLEVQDAQAEQIGHVVDQPLGEQLGHSLFAESFNVECPARREVHDLFEQLRRTRRVHAVRVALVAATNERVPALGTGGRKRPLLGASPARFDDRAHHLGNDVAGLAHDDQIPGPYVLRGYLVLVVQGRHRHRRARDDDGLKDGEGRGPPRATDRDLDLYESRCSLLGRELARDRPARSATREAQTFSLGEVVDLDHRAIDVVAKIVAMRLEPVAAFDRGGRAFFDT